MLEKITNVRKYSKIYALMQKLVLSNDITIALLNQQKQLKCVYINLKVLILIYINFKNNNLWLVYHFGATLV